ncbi:MAG: sterol carrier family protein [Mycobacteriales bacterium]
MPKFVNAPESVRSALAAIDAGAAPSRETLKLAVLHLLHVLARRAPGRSVEVRVPPFGAVQCARPAAIGAAAEQPSPRSPVHRRGTPPNVVQTDPVTWLLLASGQLSWKIALADGRLSLSVVRADVSNVVSELWR